jgi:NAD(P)-dependent dehydrogenase (short-subunit alcohol dehydrogenase family)
VAITSRDIEKLKYCCRTRIKTGGTCLPLQCDVRHYEEVENMLQGVLKAFGHVDVLLNNAAGISFHPERLSANAFDTVIDIVLKELKLYTSLRKHWIDTKQVSSTVLNIVTTYA